MSSIGLKHKLIWNHAYSAGTNASARQRVTAWRVRTLLGATGEDRLLGYGDFARDANMSLGLRFGTSYRNGLQLDTERGVVEDDAAVSQAVVDGDGTTQCAW